MKIFWKKRNNLWGDKSRDEKYLALQYAVISDKTDEIVKRVKEGIDINTTEENGDGNILMYFIQNADKRIYDHKEYTNLLIDLGININHQRNGTMKRASALTYAVTHKRLEIAQILIENNADLEIKDIYGNTPLWKAVMDFRGNQDSLEIIKLLIQKGANLDAENDHGKSPRSVILDRHNRVSLGGAMENHPTAKSWDLIELVK